MNEINTNEVLAAVEAGEATLVKTSNKGKLITGGIAVVTTVGAAAAGYAYGKHRTEKKFEERLTALEEALYGEDYEEYEDFEDEESEEEAPAKKKSKKASKPEKVEGEVED